MTGNSKALRILIIEDSPVIALATEEMLSASGFVPAGPVGNMASALEYVENGEMDAAIVDLNIRGAKTFGLFSVLKRRNIPFLIMSGYADWKMPDEWADRPRLQKPFSEEQLSAKLSELLPAWNKPL
jgi:DNA-binding NtrC family response regulator